MGVPHTRREWLRACRHYAIEHEGTHRRVRIGRRRVIEATSGWTTEPEGQERMRSLALCVVYMRHGELVDEYFEWDAQGRLAFHSAPIERGEP